MEMITLDNFCSSVRDGTHDSPKPQENGFFLITSKHIKNNSIDFSSAYRISQEDYIKINKRSNVEKWDLLMSMIGTVGRLCIVKDAPNYAIKNLALFKIGEETKAKYLYYYLSTENVQKYFDAVANGTSQHFVGLGYLRKFKIPKMTDKHVKVIKILEKYDSLIENNNKRIKLLEQTAQEIYKEWFVRFRFPNYENEEFLNGIPKRWNNVRLGEIMDFDRGKGYSSKDILYSDGMTLLSMNNIKAYGGFVRDFTRPYCGTYKECHVLNRGDLIMSITDMTQERRVIGYCGLVTEYNEQKMIACTHLLKISSKMYNNIFLYCLFTYSGLSKNIASRATGTNVLGLTKEIVSKVKTIIPPMKLINAFLEKVKPIFELIEKLILENENLIKQRDLLLPRLMSGKLEVK